MSGKRRRREFKNCKAMVDQNNWYQAQAWQIPTSSRVRLYAVVEASDPKHAASRLRKLLPGYSIAEDDVNPNPCKDTDDFGIRERFPLPGKI